MNNKFNDAILNDNKNDTKSDYVNIKMRSNRINQIFTPIIKNNKIEDFLVKLRKSKRNDILQIFRQNTIIDNIYISTLNIHDYEQDIIN